jgi:trimeric autotransporter adhesin
MKNTTLSILLACGLFTQTLQAQHSWNPLGAGTNAPVQAMTADTVNHVLYAGGVFTSAGSISGSDVAKWDGTNWSPLGVGVVSGVGISSMIMKSGELIVGGTFTDIGGVISKNVAKWNGVTWLPLGAGLEYTGATTVSTLCEYGGELYAGGTFLLSGVTPVNYIAKYDGTSWLPVGGGTNGRVLSLAVYAGELYAGGEFTNAGGVAVNNIAKWNGTTWSDVGGGVQYTGATTVSTLQVFLGDLFAGGTFDLAGSTPVMNIAKWDGSNWSDVGGGVQYTGATTVSTLSMTIYENQLIAGGILDVAGGASANYIAKWDGFAWSSLGTGMNNAVLALETLDDTLYAGGWFTQAGGDITLFISQWVPEPTHVSSINGIEKENNTFRIYPNPVDTRIVIQNKFTPVNGSAAEYDFILSDLLGNTVSVNKNITNEIGFDRTQIPSGLYLYKLVSKDNQVVQQGKLSFR